MEEAGTVILVGDIAPKTFSTMRPLLSAIPIRVVTDDLVNLIGAARCARSEPSALR